jgi:glycerophosphoryl diester phosphodiesterase
MNKYLIFIFITVGCGVNALVSTASWFYNSETPLVFASAGSMGQYPEHSSAAYIDAFLNGADFIDLMV